MTVSGAGARCSHLARTLGGPAWVAFVVAALPVHPSKSSSIPVPPPTVRVGDVGPESMLLSLMYAVSGGGT